MKKCPYCHEEASDEVQKCRFCGEWFVQGDKKPIDQSMVRFPKTWVGYVLAAIMLAIEIGGILSAQINLPKIFFSGFIALLGWTNIIYWNVCLYQIHKRIMVMANGCYPITVGRAVGFGFLPFYNLYWMFKWPHELIAFVQSRSNLKTWAPWVPGLLLLLATPAGLVSGALGQFVSFLPLVYLTNILEKSLAANPNTTPYKNKPTSLPVGAIIAIVLIASVPVIGMLAAIAIPNFLRAKYNANDYAAQADLQIANAALENFHQSQQPPTYPTTLDELITGQPSYLDSSWTGNVLKHGHTITYTPGAAVDGIISQYTITGNPVQGQAQNGYCIDQTGVLRGNLRADASTGDGTCTGTPVRNLYSAKKNYPIS